MSSMIRRWKAANPLKKIIIPCPVYGPETFFQDEHVHLEERLGILMRKDPKTP